MTDTHAQETVLPTQLYIGARTVRALWMMTNQITIVIIKVKETVIPNFLSYKQFLLSFFIQLPTRIKTLS